MTGTSNSDKAALGDRVFLDLNGDGFQDGNEPGVAHVTVRLQIPKGETIRSVVTDDNGFFLFDNLDSGDYKFTVIEPDGFNGFTLQNARGVDDSADSDGKKLGSDTAVKIFDEIIGIHLLQEIEFDTSCSDPIQLGDQIGSLTIVGYTGENGSANLTQEQIDSLVG